MFQSRTAKIALVVLLVVILGIVAYFYFFRSSQEKTADESKTVVTDDKIGGSGSLPQNTGTGAGGIQSAISGTTTTLPGQSPVGSPVGTPSTTSTITPYPGSGAFDWTRNKTPEPLEIELTTEQIQKLQSGDICEIANISDSWSNPIEKISCGLTKYFEEQIIVPLQIMACNFMGAAISTNYKSGIEAKMDGNVCKLFDR